MATPDAVQLSPSAPSGRQHRSMKWPSSRFPSGFTTGALPFHATSTFTSPLLASPLPCECTDLFVPPHLIADEAAMSPSCPNADTNNRVQHASGVRGVAGTAPSVFRHDTIAGPCPSCRGSLSNKLLALHLGDAGFDIVVVEDLRVPVCHKSAILIHPRISTS